MQIGEHYEHPEGAGLEYGGEYGGEYDEYARYREDGRAHELSDVSPRASQSLTSAESWESSTCVGVLAAALLPPTAPAS